MLSPFLLAEDPLGDRLPTAGAEYRRPYWWVLDNIAQDDIRHATFLER